MYGIGRAEAARFERPSKCFERPSKVLRATQQKGVGAVSVTRSNSHTSFRTVRVRDLISASLLLGLSPRTRIRSVLA